jgi:hypothetical protein
VELVERQLRGGEFPFALWNQLRQMAIDPSLRVRHQLALTLGEIRGPESARVLAALFSRASGNPWMQTAILSSLAERAGDVFVNLANDPRGRGWVGVPAPASDPHRGQTPASGSRPGPGFH